MLECPQFMRQTVPDNLPAPRTWPVRVLAALALASALALGVSMGIRPVTSPDIGYHLAYGEQFFQTGKIVDTNPYIYMLDPSQPAAQRPAPGPGCWYDEAGQYRFANANWLTQVIFAALYRAGGMDALTALGAVLTAAIFGLALWTMRRCGLGVFTSALGLVLIAMVAYERFVLRPESFSYVILLAQLAILLPAYRRMAAATEAAKCQPQTPSNEVLSWKAIAILVVLQVLMANLHSYFLLGLALTGVIFADRVLRLIFARILQSDNRIRKAKKPSAEQAFLRRQVVRLAILLVAQVAACFINPWTWRLAILPFQTVLFLRANNIGPEIHDATGHPWSLIGEFFRPLEPGYAGAAATIAYCVLLGLACIGLLAALLRRRWAYAFLIGAMVAVSLSMRRNIAPAVMVLSPTILAAIADLRGTWWLAWARRLAKPKLVAAAGASLAIFAGLMLGLVVTQQLYYHDRSPARFGWHAAPIDLPLDACHWLDEHHVQGRLWVDYASSSNFYFFTQPHRDVPTLTNTWAYPPDTMKAYLDYVTLRRPFGQAIDGYGVQVVAMKVDQAPALARALADAAANLQPSELAKKSIGGHWALVYLDGPYAIFVRKDGLNAGLAEQFEIPHDTLPARAIEHFAQLDPKPAYGLWVAGLSLQIMGWENSAIESFRASLQYDPSYFRTWTNLGVSLGRRAGQHEQRHEIDAATKDRDEAKSCFQKAISLCETDSTAWFNLGICLMERGEREMNRGNRRNAQEEWKEARSCLQKAMELCTVIADKDAIRHYLDRVEDELRSL